MTDPYTPPLDRASAAFKALFAGENTYDKSVLDLVAIQNVLFNLAQIASGNDRKRYWRATKIGAESALDGTPMARWPGQEVEK